MRVIEFFGRVEFLVGTFGTPIRVVGQSVDVFGLSPDFWGPVPAANDVIAGAAGSTGTMGDAVPLPSLSSRSVPQPSPNS